MNDEDEKEIKFEDLLRDKTILKQVVVAGRLGPKPEWGDEVRLKYTLREKYVAAPLQQTESRVFRTRSNWKYTIGDDDATFLPRRFAEIVVASMTVGEKSKFIIDTRCFIGDEAFIDAPWLHTGTDGYERVDVEEIEYVLELVALRKGETPIGLVSGLTSRDSGSGLALTKRRPLRESAGRVSLCHSSDELDSSKANGQTSLCLESSRNGAAPEATQIASGCTLTGKDAYAGRDWLPWGDAGHPDSTWNTIQEAKATALRLRDTTSRSELEILQGPCVNARSSDIAKACKHETPIDTDCANQYSVQPSTLDTCVWDFTCVRIQIEALDARGTKLLPRQVWTYTHGQGEQWDCVEIAVSTMSVGESCDVRCQSRASLQGGPLFQQDPWLPVSFRLRLEAIETQPGLGFIDPFALPLCERLKLAAKVKHIAASLYRQGRHVLATEKYKMLLSIMNPCIAALEDKKQRRAIADLRRHCHVHCAGCELRLQLWTEAKKTAEALLAEDGKSAEGLTLRGQALMASDPKAACADLLLAVKLDPASKRIQKLLEKSRKESKSQRRAKAWFDGQGVDLRISQAKDAELCFQCNRLRPGGHVADSSSKWPGRYFCTECWECWTKIRRCQQRELDKRVDKAIHSDYSTHTDELPSLDDAPKEWDSAHPMWKRQNAQDPDWQFANLDEKTKARIRESNSRRAERQGV